MPNQKISELTAIVTVDNSVDVLPIVDISANTTKKVTPNALKTALALDNVNNTSDANKPVSIAQQDALNAKVDENAPIVAATKTKITYDAKGLVTAGDILDAADMPTGINAANIGTGVVSSTEFGYLDGVTSAIQTQINSKQATLVSGTNIKTINSTSLLGSGDITISANPSGVSGAIQFSNGSAFASDAANLFWDDTNNRLGVGTNAPSATGHLAGSSNTATDYALKVLNLRGQGILSVANDGVTEIGDFSGQGYNGTLSFLRPSGATRATTFSQGSSNLTITNAISTGNAIFQNFPIQISGRGSTSATTSLLVQNSAGNPALQVDDDRGITLAGSPASGFVINATGTNAAARFGACAIGTWGVGGIFSLGSTNSTATRIATNNIAALYLDTNQSVNVGVVAAVASAQLQVDSTTKGLLPPRMTNSQRTSISSPAVGLMVYCTDAVEGLYVYKSTGWTLVI
jgi:hypothetical protein